nr:MAG TPA: zipper dimerization domain transcription factor-like protein [Caudoviricetes sp.]
MKTLKQLIKSLEARINTGKSNGLQENCKYNIT